MITEKQFNSLYSNTITKKRYDTIIELINQRVDEICKKFLSSNGGWYDYDNRYDETDGFFDPEMYKAYISFDGTRKPPVGWEMEFPTRWLWTADGEWEKEMLQVSQSYKQNLEIAAQKSKDRREKLKTSKQTLIASIKSKLTPEELKIVKFK